MVGWLEKWLTRYHVKCAVLCGENEEVKEDVLQDWSRRLPVLCSGYDMKDIFNADETGIFFRALPSRSMIAKGDNASGTKTCKMRITAMVAVSAKGEKLKPLIIGKSAKPRCFQGFNISELGVIYKYNRKAWMTSEIFKEWANIINNKMLIQGRNILMFVDNCAAHPHLQLSNLKFVFLLPNTTSKLQPGDTGIIQTLKLNYRKRLMRHILYTISQDTPSSGSDLLKTVTLLDAIMWWKGAWDLLQEDTVMKCFAKCGFQDDRTPPATIQEPEVHNHNLRMQKQNSLLPSGVSIEDFANFDNAIQTSAESNADGENEFPDSSSDLDDTLQDENDICTPVIDCKTASLYTSELIKYGLATNHGAVANVLLKFQLDIQTDYLNKKLKQTTIDKFFNQV